MKHGFARMPGAGAPDARIGREGVAGQGVTTKMSKSGSAEMAGFINTCSYCNFRTNKRVRAVRLFLYSPSCCLGLPLELRTQKYPIRPFPRLLVLEQCI